MAQPNVGNQQESADHDPEKGTQGIHTVHEAYRPGDTRISTSDMSGDEGQGHSHQDSGEEQDQPAQAELDQNE